MLIYDGEQRHYTAIKSLSRLPASGNSTHKCKQRFCMNCLQGFQYEESRDKHFEYCEDNETVRIEMPKEDSFVKFHDGQYRFNVPFAMYTYADLKQILSQSKNPHPTQKAPTL